MKRASKGVSGNTEQESKNTSSNDAVPLGDMNQQTSGNLGGSSVESLDVTEELPSEDTATLLSAEEEGSSTEKAMNVPVLKYSHKIPRILLHAGLCVVGIALVVAGGVGSQYTPYVDSEVYDNCSFTNSSYDAV